jgi:hypothetical protein
MTILQVGTLLVRLFAIGWIIQAVFLLTMLPTEIWALSNPHTSYLTSLYNISTAMRLLMILMHVGVGIAYWVFAVPLAKFVSKGL